MLIFQLDPPMKVTPFNNSRYCLSTGFTLIELMIAIFISALIFTLMIFGLKTMIHHYRALEIHQHIFKEMQMNFWECQQDFANLMPRKVTDENHMLLPVFMGNNQSIEMTTSRGSLIRRAYFYEASKKQFIERTYAVLDRIKNNQYKDKVLFNGINAVEFKYFVNQLGAQSESDIWPLNNNNNKPAVLSPNGLPSQDEKSKDDTDKQYPDAVSLRMNFENNGWMTRFFLVKKNV